MRINECKVNSYKKNYKVICDVSYKNRPISKFKNFVINAINMFKPGEVVINNNPRIFATVHESHVTKPYFNFITSFLSTSFIVTNTKNKNIGFIQTNNNK